MSASAESIHGKQTRPEMEVRRLSAASDLRGGMRQAAVARKYSVSTTTAYRWNDVLLHGGNLKSTRARGRPPRLTPLQLSQFANRHRGFPWTGKQFASAIEAEFGVHYDQDYAYRLMKKAAALSDLSTAPTGVGHKQS